MESPPVPQAFAPYLPPALAEVHVPAYVVDRTGTVCWLNSAARQVMGDAVGQPFTRFVDMPEAEAWAIFERHINHVEGGDTEVALVGPGGMRTRGELSSVPLGRNHHAIGMFGLVVVERRRRSRVADSPLTKRQQEVLELLADGVSTREIAGRLFLSEQTVRNHVRQVLARLEVKSRLAAVAEARRRGLV